MYKINPSSYSSVFVIPTEIADKHLRLAGKAQLKVLLWLYRNPNTPFDIPVISRETGIPADEIDDAMLYWVSAGLVVKDGEEPAPVEVKREPVVTPQAFKIESTAPPAEEKKKETPERAVIVKPSIKDIARRLNESEEISSMFNEVQEVFGRTLGYDGQSNLLILHDHYGLPAEVIVMLCSYAKTIGKQGAIAYIVQTGKAWADEGITDFDSANTKIERLEKAHKIWDEFRRLTGVENPRPTSKQVEFLEIWINDFHFDIDIIYLAYEKTVEAKGKISFSYMNGILRSWHDSGFATVGQIEQAAAEFALGTQSKKKNSKRSDPVKKPSYDIDKAMAFDFDIDPAKTNKGK